MQLSGNRYLMFFLYGIIFLFYYLFPSQNNSTDAWAFATEVKWNKDLFYPHHLLYNWIGYWWIQFFHELGIEIDVMRGLIHMNSVVALLSFIVLNEVLIIQKLDIKRRISLTVFTAFSFGFWRYATENEAYQWPILFSLIASYFFCKFIYNARIPFLLTSGLFAALACLFHQMHIIWWLGLLTGGLVWLNNSKRKNLVFFILPAFIIPLAYLYVIIVVKGYDVNLSNTLQFVFRDFYQGHAGASLSINHFFFGIVNTLRTFFQLHGNINIILNAYPTLWITVLLSVLLLSAALLKAFSSRKLIITHFAVFNTFTFILILHWLFSLYNVGNAEFMVMIPVLLSIIFSATNIGYKPLLSLALAMFVWNLTFGIWPNYALKFRADEEIAQVVQKNPDKIFVLSDHARVQNMVNYNVGKFPQNILSGPQKQIELTGTLDILSHKIDNLLIFGNLIYTDLSGEPQTTSRANLIARDVNKEFMKRYDVDTAQQFNTGYGKHTLLRILNPH